jgi:CPA2 family monovalent cation:H+ antiporter-2
MRQPALCRLLPDARRLRRLDTPAVELRDHAVIAGFGNVGHAVGAALTRHGIPFVVVEQSQQRIEELKREGIDALFGDASNIAVLEHVRLEDARLLIAATADATANEQMALHALKANPNLEIVVRTRTLNERDAVREHGVHEIVVSDIELALTIIRRAFSRLGIDDETSLETIRQMRHDLDQEHDVRRVAFADSASLV